MKKLFTLLLPMLLLAVGAMAQTPTKYRVSGKVVDSTTNEPVAYATIIVRDKDNKPYVSTYSADKGEFECRLADGTYMMVAGFTGYTPDTLTVTVAGKAIALDPILITEGLAIGAVQVLGQLITSDVDKMSYNTAADPETPALTALEMMRKVPMLTVDGEDNLQLKGQSDYKILVNGKPSTMMTKNYKDVLKSMPASSIVRIEVITNPPAKYDAEGVGGLINIITTRKAADGFNGSVNLGVDQWGGVRGGAYIAVQSGKFALSANISAGQYESPKTGSTSERIDSTSIDRYRMAGAGSGRYKGLNGGLNLEASYQIDTANLLTLSVSGWAGGGENYNDQTQDYFSKTGLETLKAVGKARSNYHYLSLGGNLDYQHTFKNPDETLTASYRFDASPEGDENDVEANQTLGTPLDPNFNYHRRASGDNSSFEHTLQVDYYNPLTKIHQIEVGLKYIARPNTTNNNYERWENEHWMDDNERRKNDLDYVQHIGSFYAGYAAKLKWLTAKVGVRGELTINDGKYLIGRSETSMFNRYFNIVPYVTLNFKLDDANSIRVGYTQRIGRPSIWLLNPHVNDLDPATINTGNANLEATLNHNVNLNYSIYKPKWNFGINASAYWANNSVERVSKLIEPGDWPYKPEYAGRIWNTYQNIADAQSYRIGVNGGARFFDNKLNFSLNLSASYSIVDAPKVGMHSEGFGWNGHANVGGQPWKNGNVNLHAGIHANARGLQNAYSPYFYNGISVSQSMLKKKLRVSLSCNDPFETKKYRTNESWGPGFSTSSEFWSYGRSFRLSLQWSFGKLQAQVKKAKRGIANDDGGSGGNKGGSGGGGE